MADFRATPAIKRISEEIFNSLNHEKIVSEIRNTTFDFPDWDWQTIAEIVYLVAEKYLARDIQWMEISGIEYRFEYNGESGIYDMCGRFTELAPDKYAGKTFIRDWKTTGGALDDRWIQRYLNSWQWRIYLYNSQADYMIYTGVTTAGEARELYIPRPDNLESQVRNQLITLNTIGEALRTAEFEIYPMNQPQACFSYGSTCPYRDDCTNLTMPRQSLVTWNWSPSSIEQYLLCPERFRREQLNKINGEPKQSNRSAEIGSAFHRGIAEIYKQGWNYES